MASVYDAIADSCAAIAAKTKSKSHKVRLNQLVEQWRSVAADQWQEAVRIPYAVVEPTAPVRLAKPVANTSRWSLKRGRPKKKRA
jgi:hypothetical protein